MENRFEEGQKVICISNNFPHIKKYGGSEGATTTPKKGEILVIDEVLGDFLRFDKYDTYESYNWWMFNRFSLIDDMELALEELISSALSVKIT